MPRRVENDMAVAAQDFGPALLKLVAVHECADFGAQITHRELALLEDLRLVKVSYCPTCSDWGVLTLLLTSTSSTCKVKCWRETDL